MFASFAEKAHKSQDPASASIQIFSRILKNATADYLTCTFINIM